LWNDLKELHSDQFDAFDIYWMIWATDIQSKPSHLHDELILRGPHKSLIHLFCTSGNNTFQSISYINQIGIGMVDSIMQQTPVIRENLHTSVDLAESDEDEQILFVDETAHVN